MIVKNYARFFGGRQGSVSRRVLQKRAHVDESCELLALTVP